MIKRLWQFPAVIGGTALLTFCGVSALQASINAPLHAFGAAVEAARASASASLSPTLVAAPPVQKPGGTDVEATPASPQIQAAAAAPTSPVPQAAPAPAPAAVPAAPAANDDGQGAQREGSQSGQDAGSSQGDQGQSDQGQGNQGQGNQGQGNQGNGNGWGAGNGLTAAVTRGSGSIPGTAQASGQQGHGLTQPGATRVQIANSQAKLLSELNHWLGLVDPNLALKGAQGGGSSGAASRPGAGQQDSQQ